MRAWIAIIAAALLLTGAGSALAQQYGEAVVEEGRLTIVREGQGLNVRPADGAVPVNEGDLLRVRDASRVRLNSRERAEMMLGANAVFHVNEWQKNERSGWLNSLFGRFRSAVAEATGGERFSVNTATATIGVKGTEWTTATTSNGDTMVLVGQGTVGLQGLSGGEQDVQVNQLSVTIGGRPASVAIFAPEGLQNDLQNLESADPTSNEAANLPSDNILDNLGLTGGTGGEEDLEPDFDSGTAIQNLYRSELDVRFNR